MKQDYYSLDIYFVETDQATSFYEYAKSGRFYINGKMYVPRHRPSNPQVQPRDQKLARAMIVDKVRRCIELSWNTNYEQISKHQRHRLYIQKDGNGKLRTKPVLYHDKHPSLVENPSDFNHRHPIQKWPFALRNNLPYGKDQPKTSSNVDYQHAANRHSHRPSINPSSIENGNPFNVNLDITLGDIKESFSTLGEIVSILPMIRPLPTILIEYADVKSAIQAHRVFSEHDYSNPIWVKFFEKWTLAYAMDVTDRTCPPGWE
ncbi:hypothetical protein AWJ20_1295 [Sugiyamaella lignohabitans]|uniref:RRM domain-containing protein n=1 Tax=Sugiyamaella lignohabitans TaxID=796027 RepID=A0A161HJR9_9ASCO|nr:uncharacterized protein AWJ20_1295 [Sugiyamaella lignohabitans]ANB13017.1 hypothetical protein AWJ20_1295 [Sugiyamaella lignohabitans]